MMVDAQVTKWRYRRNQRNKILVGVYYIIRHRHTEGIRGIGY